MKGGGNGKQGIYPIKTSGQYAGSVQKLIKHSMNLCFQFKHKVRRRLCELTR